jgi:hypothetical protein
MRRNEQSRAKILYRRICDSLNYKCRSGRDKGDMEGGQSTSKLYTKTCTILERAMASEAAI